MKLSCRAGLGRPIPETYCVITVASAAPPIPRGITATKRMSRAMFKTALTARNISGAEELPSALSMHEKNFLLSSAEQTA